MDGCSRLLQRETGALLQGGINPIMAGGFLSGPKVGNFHHFRKVIPLSFVLHGEISLQSLEIAPLVQEISGGVFFSSCSEQKNSPQHTMRHFLIFPEDLD